MSAADSLNAPLRIAVRHEGAHCIVVLAGAASMEQVPALESQLSGLRTAGAAKIVLDFSELAFISSPGIGVIVAAHHAARARGGSVRIAHATPQVERMLRLTHLDQVIPMHATVGEAKAAN